jgi:hypothetical protein
MKSIPEARSQKPEVRNLTSDGCLPTSDLCFPASERGVALVITVILLAVVTFMALTFLAISRRERGAVTTTTDTYSAKLAADDALANAEAQIVANVLATANPYNFGLLVSTNYINPAGFYTGVSGFTNVNYSYPNGNPLSPADFLQNLANLYYSPRPPVFVPTNVDPKYALDFRFYLDLNRNGQDDPNGQQPQFGNAGGYLHPGGIENNNPANVLTNNMTGDPEWVGVLQHPDQPYGPNNLFVARYAFIAVPIGNALDLNAIHDQSLDAHQGAAPVNIPPNGDAFLRNQGVGSWELNLAAFLADLNTNQWLPNLPPANLYYAYNPPPAVGGNKGVAFDDARALLAYRYANRYQSLQSADTLFFPNGSVFRNDDIDGYSDGPLQTGFELPFEDDISSLPWAGADNTNQYFDLQDLFDTSKTATGLPAAQVTAGADFSDRLLAIGTNSSTYNRYTYYRLASQMGVESEPEQDKINLNYSNALANFDTNGVVTKITVFPGAETNFIQWTPLQFFTIAADKMLREYSQSWIAESPSNYVLTYGMYTNTGTVVNPTNIPVPFGITNIPVWVNNQFVYTPAVQRVLQLAANIYDATTNNTAVEGANFPSVFRPIFFVTNDTVSGYTNVYINGYEQVVSVVGTNDVQLNRPVDVADLLNPNPPLDFGPGVWINVNVYGVPWIIGAKKGFPNFNEFSMESMVGITRRLQVTRPAVNPASPPVDYTGFRTNQMYTMCISNQLGVECWNSYTNNYVPVSPLLGLTIVVRDTLSMVLTNDDGMTPVTTGNLFLDNSVNIASSQYWPGVLPWDGDGHPNPNSFDIPLLTTINMQLNPSFAFTTNWWAYRFDTHQFLPTPTDPLFETDIPGFPFPQFGLLTTNRLQVFMLDGNHVIDYAQFAGPDSTRNLNAEIFNDQDINSDVWLTNASTASTTLGAPDGILNQLLISRGLQSGPNLADDGNWRSDPEAVPLGGTIAQQQSYFDGFFKPGNVGRVGSTTAQNLSLTNQAPYDPTRYVVLYTTWQANDPLVHYTASDLNYTLPTGNALEPGTNRFNYGETIPTLTDANNGNLGQLNNHYTPWGRPTLAPDIDTNAYNLAFKDPLVWQSQDWDFPTYKMPTVGWLGRVHRGTPWQTVYLKSPDILQEIQLVGTATNYIGTNTWVQWTGDAQLRASLYYDFNYDAANAAPVQDRLLFDNFTTTFNDNATRGTLSVNVGANDPNNLQAGLAAWSALFSGVIPLSDTAATPFFNALTEEEVQHANTLTNFIALAPINPAGPTGPGSVLGQIVTNINLTRANFVNPDGLVGAFEHAGDILAAPMLTVESPFVNWTNATQQANGISDEMYEWLPQQVMSLLRVSGTTQSPVRYVIYSYGQTLKPAPNGIYTGSGQYFGMVTNYQVVAEAATRTVLRFNGTRVNNVFPTNDVVGNSILTNVPSITNNQVVIERFNTLPAN